MTWDEEAVARHLWLERKCIVARLEGRCHRGLTFAAAHMDPAVLIIEYGRNTAVCCRFASATGEVGGEPMLAWRSRSRTRRFDVSMSPHDSGRYHIVGS